VVLPPLAERPQSNRSEYPPLFGQMDHQAPDLPPVADTRPQVVQLAWALGALGSLLLAMGHLPYALFLDAISGGGSPLFGFPAILLAQVTLCLACTLAWPRAHLFHIGIAVAFLTAAHAVVAVGGWQPYHHMLWMLWIGPVPMLIPAFLEFTIRRPGGKARLGLALSWGLGALASVLLTFAHLVFAVVIAFSIGLWAAYAFPATLLVQATLCIAGVFGIWHTRPLLLSGAALLVAVAQGGFANILWISYSPHLWMLWVGPLPLIIPTLIQLATVVSRRPRSVRR
jgi:hypothetical protein